MERWHTSSQLISRCQLSEHTCYIHIHTHSHTYVYSTPTVHTTQAGLNVFVSLRRINRNAALFTLVMSGPWPKLKFRFWRFKVSQCMHIKMKIIMSWNTVSKATSNVKQHALSSTQTFAGLRSFRFDLITLRRRAYQVNLCMVIHATERERQWHLNWLCDSVCSKFYHDKQYLSKLSAFNDLRWRSHWP